MVGKTVHVRLARYSRDACTGLYSRENFWVDGSSIVETTIQELNDLNSGQELTINSTIRVDGQSFHIPMVDFQHPDPLVCIQNTKRVFGFNNDREFSFFDSGRSVHAYGSKLEPDDSWYALMGTILHLNPKTGIPVVDSRWVGHRLIAGYSSLRWSNNTGRYVKLPTRIEL